MTIILENYVSDLSKMQAVFNRIRQLNSLTFNPYSPEWEVANKGWPLITEMLNANKRFLIVDYNSEHARKSPGFILPQDFFIENHWEWSHDTFNWPLTNMSSSTLKKIDAYLDHNMTSLNLEISKCVSVQKVNRTKHAWDEENILNLSTRQTKYEPLNSEKLFLFNHFYGVSGKSSIVNPVTVKLMNSKEFVMKRFNEKCKRASGFAKPNFIALDFINERVYTEIIEPLNA